MRCDLHDRRTADLLERTSLGTTLQNAADPSAQYLLYASKQPIGAPDEVASEAHRSKFGPYVVMLPITAEAGDLRLRFRGRKLAQLNEDGGHGRQFAFRDQVSSTTGILIPLPEKPLPSMKIM